MKKQISLSIENARNLALMAQGLAESPTKKANKSDIIKTIRRIHALQIDTINIVARAPYHIIWSRIGNYDPVWLEELHQEGKIFEYWSHAACFLLIEDYPIYRRTMLDSSGGWDNYRKWAKRNMTVVDGVYQYIKENGSVKSSDFKRQKCGNGWWDWKAEKIALEYLFSEGKLMISRRDNFQRVYDLRENVLPNWKDEDAFSYEQMIRIQVSRAVKALGISNESWAASYFYLPKSEVKRIIPLLISEGSLLAVSVEGRDQETFYIHENSLGLLEKICVKNFSPNLTTLLSPFDPMITDRSRLKSLFGFDYTLECYLPASKRVYGYFSLPILHNGSFIGRLDAKAWRKEKKLEVKNIWIEPHITIDKSLMNTLSELLCQYAFWQNLETIKTGTLKKTNTITS
jgi:uncharacterized protein YcaQ